ncbi:MAG: hypothetical protein COU09_00550 [Candidatus Harrisonbacteria bacterium CG10_big_fil_rev_8_21_14_0_10_44_23]|uniref:Type 4a pilus biogenesis protein PilO n=1 Tax=Candidatus Harrisonbacteria bacterium CG10_big_fil_rev_8_21_14_0_10_44_23 TaxID=1974585 RepID=A0A2H0UQU0_9BACT|nr:MAG: hypothetical protein COU09_00550 [Candidatus Harrisonbacteria bacterium CG10_big_fil_rev_8_21_14_0_10_44_23]
MKGLSLKNKVLQSSLITVGILLVLTVIVFILGSDLSKRGDRIVAHREETALRGQMLSLLSSLKQNSLRAQQVIPSLEAGLPEQDDLVSFPRELEGVAKKRGLDFGFTFGNESVASENDVAFIRFGMTLGGSMDNLVAFLKELEDSPYYIALHSLDIARREEGGFALTSTGVIYLK